jgi:hypothetical protein
MIRKFIPKLHLSRGRIVYPFSTGVSSNGKPPKMAPFNPLDHGLNASFILTNFTKMKG